MADQDDRRKPHFILEGTAESERFRRPPRAIGSGTPPQERDRNQHGGSLLGKIDDLRPHFASARERQEAAGLERGFGLQVEFESFPNIELTLKSLARENVGIELLNVRHDEHRVLATVFVPDGKLHIFENLIRAYLDETKDGSRGPRNHKLLNTISEIRARGMWTSCFPTTTRISEIRAATLTRRCGRLTGRTPVPGGVGLPTTDDDVDIERSGGKYGFTV